MFGTKVGFYSIFLLKNCFQYRKKIVKICNCYHFIVSFYYLINLVILILIIKKNNFGKCFKELSTISGYYIKEKNNFQIIKFLL